VLYSLNSSYIIGTMKDYTRPIVWIGITLWTIFFWSLIVSSLIYFWF
jgi:hypothetical protein